MNDDFVDPELSLDGLSYAQADEYVRAYKKTFLQLEKQFEDKLKEILAWQKRVDLAESKSDTDLFDLAHRKVQSLRADASRIKAEKTAIGVKVEILQKNLKEKKGSEPLERSKQLLKQFENILGPDAALEGRIRREETAQEVEDELAALKAKMKQK